MLIISWVNWSPYSNHSDEEKKEYNKKRYI